MFSNFLPVFRITAFGRRPDFMCYVPIAKALRSPYTVKTSSIAFFSIKQVLSDQINYSKLSLIVADSAIYLWLCNIIFGSSLRGRVLSRPLFEELKIEHHNSNDVILIANQKYFIDHHSLCSPVRLI